MSNKLIRIGDFKLNSKHSDRPFVVDARYLPNESKKPVILFVHGFKGFKDWGHFNLIADAFANQGFVFVKLNLSHNGTTPEYPNDFVDLEAFSDNNFSIELDDIGVLIDHLYSNESKIPAAEVATDNLHLLGHSRGGALVLLKSLEEDRIKSVTAWAPISNLQNRWSKDTIEQWKKDGVSYIYNGRTEQNMPMKYQLIEDIFVNKPRLDVSKAVELSKVPMLLVHGTDDSTLPYEETAHLSKKNSLAELQIIENANHVFGGSHPYPDGIVELPVHTKEVFGFTLDFLDELRMNNFSIV